MGEKLSIENFGGLRSIEIDIRNINILIGPQASGKSVVAKLLYFFKSFPNQIVKSILDELDESELEQNGKNDFVKYFPEETWPDSSFKIQYHLDKSWIVIKRAKGKQLQINYSTEFIKAISYGRKIYDKERRKTEEEIGRPAQRIDKIVSSKFYEYIKQQISPVISHDQIFVPAGRSFFAHIQSSIYSLLSQNKTLDPFLIEFGAFYESFKIILSNDKRYRNNKFQEPFEVIFNSIMNGVYQRENQKDYVVHKDKRKVELAHASSGQQETLPLLLILKTLGIFEVNKEGTTLYIEEPEAHLFPTAQKKIVQLLARVYNSYPGDFQIIVTTHSPYILSSFNIHLEAGKIIKQNPDKKCEVDKVIAIEEAIEPGDLIAYSIEKGKKEVLMDRETDLISQNVLDSISDEIAIEFGKLLDIQYGHEERML